MNAFDTVRQFEETIAEYTGSKYAVAVDSCSNAIFLSCMHHDIKGREITIPSRTYPSIPCSIIHAGGKVKFKDYTWKGIYTLNPAPIIDAAKRFRRGMYIPGHLMCLSFHAKKHIPIGKGGMILTDSLEAYEWLRLARFDGREETALCDQEDFKILGWNFYMTPDQAARGMWLFDMIKDKELDDLGESPPYPDLSQFEIYTENK